MMPCSTVAERSTNQIFLPVPPVYAVPVPKTPAQVHALYGFTCLGAHNTRRCFPLDLNPILRTIVKYSRFPSDEFIRKFIPRPFLILEGHSHKKCTMEEAYYFWRITHQIVREGETPVSIAEVTKFGPGGTYVGKPIHHRGKPIGSKALQYQSCVIFNHLRYPVEVGTKVFVHNFEIAELVPPDFPL
ncbi:MAG: hypothetical protein UU98_C0021G0006 [Parcubacteria group bacterium GW2011_GWD2_42_14]|nr:MAG: hypothetical protein UU98_C0021G0006 [Parcubacteria group bacterium GW2011_GWD2_42_14]